jgi:hypothetical protein
MRSTSLKKTGAMDGKAFAPRNDIRFIEACFAPRLAA